MVGTQRNSLADLGVASLRGEHHDLDVAPFRPFADPSAYLVPALGGHHDVEQHDVWYVARDERQRLLAVGGDPDIVAAASEEELDCRDDIRLVVGDQYLASIGHAVSSVTYPVRWSVEGGSRA